MFYLDTLLATLLADYTRVPHANPNIDGNGIPHRKSWGGEKKPMNLALISHKHSQNKKNSRVCIGVSTPPKNTPTPLSCQ